MLASYKMAGGRPSDTQAKALANKSASNRFKAAQRAVKNTRKLTYAAAEGLRRLIHSNENAAKALNNMKKR